MKVHILQHVGFETPGTIAQWAEIREATVTVTRLYRGEALPAMAGFDFLVVMGGPMGIGDTDRYPWLVQEKSFLKAALAAGKKILGVCLGSQLLAEALGAKVYPNRHKEIGWFPIQKEAFSPHAVLALFAENTLSAFHWHGDTFDLPAGASLLFSSEATRHQAFVWDNRVFALQFHWEVTRENVQLLLKNAASDLAGGGPFVQPPEKMLAFGSLFSEARKNLFLLLDHISSV